MAYDLLALTHAPEGWLMALADADAWKDYDAFCIAIAASRYHA